MKVVALNKPSPTFRSLFDYFINTNLNQLSKTEDYKKEAESFINLSPSVNINDTYTILPYKLDQYNFDSKYSESEKIDLMIALDNFLTALRTVNSDLINEFDDETPELGITRQVSPPYEEYHYVGHNELDITPTNASYALSFDRD